MRKLIFIFFILIPFYSFAADKVEIRDRQGKLVQTIINENGYNKVRDRNGRLIETIKKSNNGYTVYNKNGAIKYTIRKK
jgi:hypothetical protein